MCRSSKLGIGLKIVGIAKKVSRVSKDNVLPLHEVFIGSI